MDYTFLVYSFNKIFLILSKPPSNISVNYLYFDEANVIKVPDAVAYSKKKFGLIMAPNNNHIKIIVTYQTATAAKHSIKNH